MRTIEFAQRAARIAKVASAWAADSLDMAETVRDSRVENFIMDLRLLLDHLEERLGK